METSILHISCLSKIYLAKKVGLLIDVILTPYTISL